MRHPKLRAIVGFPGDVADVLAGYWITTAPELLALLNIEGVRRGLATLAGVGIEETDTWKTLARQALGEVFTEAALMPHAVPRLGIPVGQPRAPKISIAQRVPVSAAMLGGMPEGIPAGIPDYVNLTDRMLPIRDQQSRGTCVAFATTAAREHLLPQPYDLSEQFLYWLCKEMDGSPGPGTWPDIAAEGLFQVGICREELWPYNGSQDDRNEGQGPPPKEALDDAPNQTIGGYVDLDGEYAPVPEIIIQLLLGIDAEDRHYEARPVVIGVPVYESWGSAETCRTGKIYRRIPGERLLGGHALCVVGYRLDSSVPGGGYFIVRNSWGTGWAYECPEGAGHALISFTYIEECRDELLVGTALFSHEELRAAPVATTGDRVVRRRFSEAEETFLGRVSARMAQAEALAERVEERTYRPDSSVESERIQQRTVHRITMNEQVLEISGPLAESRYLRPLAISTAVRSSLSATMERFAAGTAGFADLIAAARQLLLPDEWVPCYVVEPRSSRDRPGDLFAGARRPFRHLPIVQIDLPPLAGLPDALQTRFGVRCALPDTRFTLTLPEIDREREKPLIILDWFPVPEEARSQLGADTKVGIVDTGLDLDHPDFSNVKRDHCADFSGEQQIRDECGHGTHCAGILAGSGKSVSRYGGVAPLTELFVARVFDRDGYATLEGVLSALDWLAERDVHVISMSLGTSESPNGQSQLTQACEFLATEAHMIMCVAAGNEGPQHETVSPPADGLGVTAIAALDSERYLARFSSRGSPEPGTRLYGKPEVAGPGVRVRGARSKDCDYPPVDDEGHYTELSGTSMACPAIAGVFSLLWSACKEKERAPRKARVVEALNASCVVPKDQNGHPYDTTYEVGHGVPDIAKALERLGWEAKAVDHGGRMPDAGKKTRPKAPRPPNAMCSWIGVPLAAGWREGVDFWECENPECASRPEERYICKLAWEEYHAQANDRRWCRKCLLADWQSKREVKALAPDIIETARSRFAANLAAEFATRNSYTLPGSDGPVALRARQRGVPVFSLTQLGEPPFFAKDQSGHPSMWWTGISLVRTKKGLLSSPPTFNLTLGLLSDVGQAGLHSALAGPGLAEHWRTAHAVVLGVLTSEGRLGESGTLGSARWFSIPIVWEQDHWMAPEIWPQEIDVRLRSCFELESFDDRLTRCRGLLVQSFTGRWRGGGEAQVFPEPSLREFWSADFLGEVNARFFSGDLSPVIDQRGNLVCLNLTHADRWLAKE